MEIVLNVKKGVGNVIWYWFYYFYVFYYVCVVNVY